MMGIGIAVFFASILLLFWDRVVTGGQVFGEISEGAFERFIRR